MYIKRKIFFTIELIVISCNFFLVNDDTTFCYNVLKVSYITIFLNGIKKKKNLQSKCVLGL